MPSNKIQSAFLFPELGLKKTMSRTVLGRARLIMSEQTMSNSSYLSVTAGTVAQGVVSPRWIILLTYLIANTLFLPTYELFHTHQVPCLILFHRDISLSCLISNRTTGRCTPSPDLYKSSLFQQSLAINLTRRSSRRKSDPIFKADFHDRMADFRCSLELLSGPTTT
jgi:hypothetical protein